jgi:PAS domain-containing protein
MKTDFRSFGEELESALSGIVNSPDAFVAISYEFCFLYLNAAAEKFYRKKKEQVIGQKVEDVFPDQWNFGPFRDVRKKVAERKHFEINYNSPFANQWVRLIGRPFENYYTFTYRTIDHKEVLKKELRQQYRKK